MSWEWKRLFNVLRGRRGSLRANTEQLIRELEDAELRNTLANVRTKIAASKYTTLARKVVERVREGTDPSTN